MKRTAYKLILIGLVVFVASGLWSCKSKKATIDSNLTKDWEFNNALNDVLGNELQYTNLSAKGTFEIKTGQSDLKANAVYKIIKDSVMQISIRIPLLGEIVSLNMTPDSIIVIDRRKGRYTADSYENMDFMKSIDFNYYNFQALLTNKLFVPGKQSVGVDDYARFKMSKVTDVLMLQTSGEPDVLYNFAVDATEKVISVLIAQKDLNSTVQFTYSNFIEDSGQIYPTAIEGSLSRNGSGLGIAMVYPSFEIDKKNMKVDIKIPRKYKKVTFKELIEPYFKMK